MAQAKVVLVDGLRFVGNADSGHSVVMDAPVSVGGGNTSQTPMELLLSALGGCTGMDVISILKKKKQNVSSLEVYVSGEKSSAHPKVYGKLHVEYVVAGTDISGSAVERAIALSLEKYCSVGAMLGKASEVTHSYRIVSP